jgi:hypothetical protein
VVLNPGRLRLKGGESGIFMATSQAALDEALKCRLSRVLHDDNKRSVHSRGPVSVSHHAVTLLCCAQRCTAFARIACPAERAGISELLLHLLSHGLRVTPVDGFPLRIDGMPTCCFTEPAMMMTACMMRRCCPASRAALGDFLES